MDEKSPWVTPRWDDHPSSEKYDWTWYVFPAGGLLGLWPIYEGFLELEDVFLRVNGADETEETSFEDMLERCAGLGHGQHALAIVHPTTFKAFDSWTPLVPTTLH